mgnify:FL=1
MILMIAASAAGADIPGRAGDGEDAVWHINADRLVYKEAGEVYQAFGNVSVQKGETRLTADAVRVNRQTMEAEATGDVTLKTGRDFISGSRMQLNLEDHTGVVEDGLIFIEKQNFYIRGDTIKKTGKSSYRIRRGSFTTCDGSSPDWQVTGRQLWISMGGYGTIQHAALRAKKLPLVYLPYFIFPAKTERQSGLLAPEIGYSGDNGMEYAQPYFWAINRNMDATFYYHHLQNRGEKLGIEFRYAAGSASKGTLKYDYLNDDQVDDGLPENSDWAFEGDNYLRENTDRYWFRMKADQQLPWEMTAQLDLDIVSDQDYLREFDDGMTGFSETNTYFESEFDRDLDEENDPVRENRLNVNRLWTRYAFNADVLWYDNVVKRRHSDTDDTLQQLPAITLNALKQPLGPSPLYFEANSEYSYFYREDGMTGHRLDLYPRFSLPLRLNPYFSFEPSLGLRQTSWSVDASDTLGNDEYTEDEEQHRQFYDVEAVLSTDLYRVYNNAAAETIPVKHTMIPELRYEYVPDSDQSEFPNFDSIDRLEPENRMTFALTHLLTAKHVDKNADKIPGGRDPALFPQATYNRFLRFRVGQSYNFNHQKPPESQPFEPLYAELDLSPRRFLNLRAEAEWSHEEGCLLSHLLSGQVYDNRGDRLTIEYRYDKDTRQSIDLWGTLVLTPKIQISGLYERNLEDDIDIEKAVQCLYKSQCWSVAFTYRDEEDDVEFSAMIRLHGLGQTGEGL